MWLRRGHRGNGCRDLHRGHIAVSPKGHHTRPRARTGSTPPRKDIPTLRDRREGDQPRREVCGAGRVTVDPTRYRSYQPARANDRQRQRKARRAEAEGGVEGLV